MGDVNVLKRRVFLGAGVVLLLTLTAGMSEPATLSGPTKPSAAKPSGAEPLAELPLYDTASARPVGEMAERDRKFRRTARLNRLRTAMEEAFLPAEDDIVVTHHVSDEHGDLAWMPDGRYGCFVVIRPMLYRLICADLPMATDTGLLLNHFAVDHVNGDPDRSYTMHFVIAEGGSKHFDYVSRPPGAGPVHQVVARFPSGRMITFVTFENRDNAFDREAAICSEDRTVCFP